MKITIDSENGKRGDIMTATARKRPPVHPGRILKNHHLIPLSISITDLAKMLGVSRKTVSKIINEGASITPDMALRLSRAFNTTPNLWLGLQQEYDLWHAIHDSKEWLKVESVGQLAGVTA
jgi:addiction module HigA family antidote